MSTTIADVHNQHYAIDADATEQALSTGALCGMGERCGLGVRAELYEKVP